MGAPAASFQDPLDSVQRLGEFSLGVARESVGLGE